MLDGFFHLFARRPLLQVVIDLADLFIVAWAVYRVLLVVRGTRAMQMASGLGIIFAVYLVAQRVGLVTLFNLLSGLLSAIALVVVVVFQNDIRRALIRVGAPNFLPGARLQKEAKAIDEVVAAATELARHRMGASILFEQNANVNEFVASSGTEIDAALQRDLLVSLFVPEGVNKLHDGAVIVRNLRIAEAGVFFPMPEAKNFDKALGTRHRSAVGITEETDAVVVVVSEERGTISVCFQGNIISNLDGTSLRQALFGLFGIATKEPIADRKNESKTTSAGGKERGKDARADSRILAPAGPTPLPTANRGSLAPAALKTLSGVGRTTSESGELKTGSGRVSVLPPALARAHTPPPATLPEARRALEARESKVDKPKEEPVTRPMAQASTTQLPDAGDDDSPPPTSVRSAQKGTP